MPNLRPNLESDLKVKVAGQTGRLSEEESKRAGAAGNPLHTHEEYRLEGLPIHALFKDSDTLAPVTHFCTRKAASKSRSSQQPSAVHSERIYTAAEIRGIGVEG